MKVVYGHTDSIYVQMPMDKAKETIDVLNNHVRQQFPNLLNLDEHPVTLEFEKYYKTLGVGITKNRNAGLITWKDGEFLEEPEFVMTGFAAKRVAITELAKTTQLDLLKYWVNETSEYIMTAHLKKLYNDILNGHCSKWTLINRSRYRPERFIYKCIECNKQYSWEEAVDIRRKHTSYPHCLKCGTDLNLVTLEGKNPSIGAGVEGVLWWNQHNPSDKIIDSYVYMKVRDDSNRLTYINPITGVWKRPSYISAPRRDILINDFQPDMEHYAESILKKADPIYRAMEWDMSTIRRDINQRELNEWW